MKWLEDPPAGWDSADADPPDVRSDDVVQEVLDRGLTVRVVASNTEWAYSVDAIVAEDLVDPADLEEHADRRE